MDDGNPLGRDFGPLALIGFALPTMLAMVLMGLYTIVDTVFVARLVGTDALSAVNVVCPVINLIVGLGTMLATGGSAVIARKMGEGKRERASQDFTLLAGVGLLLGLLIAGWGTAFVDEIVRALGASELLIPFCRAYLHTLLLFTPANILQVLFQNFMVTAGRPGIGMALGIAAGAVNILLDALLMGPLHMGVRGAALGTGIGYLLPAAIGALFFLRNRDGLRLKKPILDGTVLAESCANGFSEMVSQAASAVTTFLFNRIMMRQLGEDGVAAITILIYAQFLLSAMFIGFSMGVAPVISYRDGKKDGEGLRRILSICVRGILAVSALTFLLANLFGDALVGAFSAHGTPVYDIARGGFRFFSFGFLFCGFNIFASAAWTALSNGALSAFLSLMRTWGWIGILLLVLPPRLGVAGVFWAVPAAECLTAMTALAIFRLHSGKKP